ncbi:hypothetical protein Bca52824_059481 [Brassica carinata]|uniref:Uncharacterized protein ycf68 n=1 Tax=Brassica carinata TaxID=52824 RepID=A0A8X7QVJ2_BRACI|nr:hypothetical protein Bca52824_059481 [Brassica carinata]
MGAGHARSRYLNRKEEVPKSGLVTGVKSSNFLFTVGSGGPEGTTTLLSSRESIHPLSVYGQLSRRRVTEGSHRSSLFMLFLRFEKDLRVSREEEGEEHLRVQYNGELYAALGKDESLEKESIDSLPIGWTIGGSDSILYLNRGSLFLSNGEKDQNMPLKDSTETKMGCQERRRSSCPLAGWAVRVREGQSLILKTSIRKSWGGKGGKALHSWFSCSWILKNHKNPELEWDSNSSPFEILRRVALWRAQYDESCRLCSGGSSCLSLASMVESVRGLIGGGLPCGGCEAVECRTLDGESLVAESITSLFSDPSSMGHVESYVNQQGPPCKAKYSWVTDSEVVP